MSTKKTPKKAKTRKAKPKAKSSAAKKTPSRKKPVKAIASKKGKAKTPKTKPRTKAVKASKRSSKIRSQKRVKKVQKRVERKSKPKSSVAKKSTAKAKPVPKTKAIAEPKGAAQPKGVVQPKGAVQPRVGAHVKPAIELPPVLVERPRPKGKVLPRQFMLGLAQAIRTAVLPLVHEARGREIIGTATTGDTTFELDRVAEKALLTYLKNARMPVAYYSEDSGYTTFTNAQPQNLLIVDPIDGTRAAKSGFESCVISIASTRIIERPCMADVDNAVVAEIVTDRVFYAERGEGVRITQDGHSKRHKLSKNAELELISWSMTVPARPAELIFPTAARLIDLSSLKGGFFACNSTSYSLTRLVMNQLDACVDIANRFLRDIPDLVKDYFINAGRGVILGIAPYDLAAGLLVAQEAGCIVTDAFGKSFDDLLLLDTSVENQRSLIGAANKELHDKLLRFFDVRIQQWERLLHHRAARAAARAEAQQ